MRLKVKTQGHRVGVSGRMDWQLFDAINGGIVMFGECRNIITRLGLAKHVKSVFVATDDPITQCGVGTGTSAVATTDTALQTETLVKAFTETSETGLTGDSPYYETTTQFNEDEANANLTEWGLFSPDDILYNHARFGSGSITGATQADPVVITDADHGLSTGTRILISGVGGMTQLNGNRYYVNALTSSTFSLYNDASVTDTLDGTGFGAYTSGGTWIVDIPKTASKILRVRVRITLTNAS